MPHIHEKIDFTVEVFIVYDDKVLLRKHDKYKIWLSVGGHIELNEDPNQAAIREVKEEVGLDIELYNPSKIAAHNEVFNDLIPPMFLNRHWVNKEHEHVTLVYFARSKDDKLRLCTDEVSEECRWFSAEELDDKDFDLKKNIRNYAKEALRILGHND